MNKHLQSLFDSQHIRTTVTLFAAAIFLMIGSRIVGITDNLPGIAMLMVGIILLYFSVLHPWRRVEYYAFLIGIFVFILLLEWIGIRLLVSLKKTEFLNEGIAMILAFFICMPGILTGIIGTLICTFRKGSL